MITHRVVSFIKRSVGFKRIILLLHTFNQRLLRTPIGYLLLLMDCLGGRMYLAPNPPPTNHAVCQASMQLNPYIQMYSFSLMERLSAVITPTDESFFRRV